MLIPCQYYVNTMSIPCQYHVNTMILSEQQQKSISTGRKKGLKRGKVKEKEEEEGTNIGSNKRRFLKQTMIINVANANAGPAKTLVNLPTIVHFPIVFK